MFPSLAAAPVADPVVPLIVGLAVAVAPVEAVALLTAASKSSSDLSPMSVLLTKITSSGTLLTQSDQPPAPLPDF